MSGVLLALLLLQTPSALQQRTGVVTGVVRTGSGLPMEGVRVAVTPATVDIADSLLESIGQTDESGRYRLENVSPGRYHVLFGRSRSPRYHPGVATTAGATTIVVTAGGTIAVSDMIIQRIIISGRVVDMATGLGRQIQSLSVCCEDRDVLTSSTPVSGVGAQTPARFFFTVPVREDGIFSLSLPPSATVLLQPRDPSIITAGQALVVGKQDITDLVVPVSSGVKLHAEVLDRFGTPVTGVSARLHSRGAVAPLIATAQVAAIPPNAAPIPSGTVRDGRMVIGRLLPGPYTLEIVAAGVHSFKREIEIGPEGTTEIRVELPFTQIPGRIVAKHGGLLPPVRTVRLLSSPPEERFLYSFPDDRGRFFVMLSPGEYRISIDSMGHPVRSVTVGDSELKNLQFVFDGINRPEIVITVD